MNEGYQTTFFDTSMAVKSYSGAAVITYEFVGISSCVGRTEFWHEYKSLRKQCINLVSTPIDKYDQRPPGKIFNFAF